MPGQEINQKINLLKTYDSWRGSPEAPLFSVILSLADKATHGINLIYEYAWASNKSLGKNHYHSHLQTLYALSKYQVRIWEVIYKHQIPGFELAATAYARSLQFVSQQYLNDPQSQNFLSLVNDFAETYRQKEKKCLTAIDRSPESINKIMQLCQP